MLTHHIPLRSNMANCLIHARNGESRHIPTRTQVISKVRAERREKEVRLSLAEYREKLMPARTHQRIANVKALPKKAGYKVVGIPEPIVADKDILKLRLKNLGFTGVRWGHLPTVSKL